MKLKSSQRLNYDNINQRVFSNVNSPQNQLFSKRTDIESDFSSSFIANSKIKQPISFTSNKSIRPLPTEERKAANTFISKRTTEVIRNVNKQRNKINNKSFLSENSQYSIFLNGHADDKPNGRTRKSYFNQRNKI